MAGRSRRVAAFLLCGALAWGCEKVGDGAGPSGTGTFVVLADSRVNFVVPGGTRPLSGSFERVLGSITLREGTRGFLDGSGTLSLDLGSLVMSDTLQRRLLVERIFRVGERPEFGSAELRVRQLYGKRLTGALPPGGVTPIVARGQLRVRDMALSRQFEGEIARTPGGYRITSATPILFSLQELGMGDERATWGQISGAGPLADPVVVTVDLRLLRRSDQ
jgi:hypothetical protein